MHLKMSSAQVVCSIYLPTLPTNLVEWLDQTAPTVSSGSTLFVKDTSEVFQQMLNLK